MIKKLEIMLKSCWKNINNFSTYLPSYKSNGYQTCLLNQMLIKPKAFNERKCVVYTLKILSTAPGEKD